MTETVEYEKGLTFEKVWAALMETRQRQEEVARSQEETARQIKEMQEEMTRSQKETDQEIKETERVIKEMQEEVTRSQKETDQEIKETIRIQKETSKRVGELTNRFGDVAEAMVVPNLVARFKDLNLVFDDVSSNKEINDHAHQICCEIDAWLENRDCVVAVETKVTPKQNDVDDHIKRMEKLRAIANYRNDTRKYYGAIAGVVMKKEVKAYILSQGFYAIEPSGETFIITIPRSPGTPKPW